jgi:hypothetical protein
VLGFDVSEPERQDDLTARHLCFAVCLRIATKETAGLELDHAAIANHLGVVLPVGSDASPLIERGVTAIRFDPNPASWGIAPVVATLNTLLRTMAVPVECSFESISRFQDWEFEDRLKDLTESDRFPIVGFDYNSLFGELIQNGQGHCAVVYRVRQMNQSIIEIYDPGPEPDSRALIRTCSIMLAEGGTGGFGWSLLFGVGGNSGFGLPANGVALTEPSANVP